jgi:hypothetical protein
MKTNAILLSMSTLLLLPACGAGSPEAYIEKSTKISCQYFEKCEEAMWDEAGFDSVKDCRDKTLDTPIGDGGTLRDLFLAGCTEFDRGAARKCLGAARKAKRACDDLETVDEPACDEVCGTNAAMGQVLADPANEELVARALEEMEAQGELEPEPEPELEPEDVFTVE